MRKIPRPDPIRAFSLIELMVILLIMVILATLLTIGLTSYTNRSKFSEIFSVVNQYQIEANQSFIFKQTYPADREDTIGSTYIQKIAFAHGTNSKKAIIYVYLNNFYSGWVDGQALIFVGEFNDTDKQRIQWTCCQAATNPIPDDTIPKSCASTCSLT